MLTLPSDIFETVQICIEVPEVKDEYLFETYYCPIDNIADDSLFTSLQPYVTDLKYAINHVTNRVL
jgi:hypothetical protein